MSKIDIVTVKKPKGRPRGPKDKSHLIAHQFNSETGKAAQAKRKTFSGGSAKISAAYSMMLSEEAPDHIKTAMGIPVEEKATWSDLIAYQTARRALGVVDGDRISFEAIKEMREVTEGKVADKIEQSGPNGTPLSAPPPIQVNFVRPKPEQHHGESLNTDSAKDHDGADPERATDEES